VRHTEGLRGSSGSDTVALEDAQHLAPGHAVDLRNPVRVPENHADLRRRQPLLRELADVLLHLRGGDLQPRRRTPLVRQSRRGHTLPVFATNTHKNLLKP
jgi:hypothetical protein